MKTKYQEQRFRESSLNQIERCNRIIEEYTGKGFDLTLRQLYYQMVARAFIENTERSYKNLGQLVNDARIAGLIDWDTITDRTRNLRQVPMWESPNQILRGVASQYKSQIWDTQPRAVEVWVEKEALAGIVQDATSAYRAAWFSCRGYVSVSELHAAALRFVADGRPIHILYFGDHDPSGIDMPRDIEDRLTLFGCKKVTIERRALNMDQIRQYNPPPNPAKVTDSRFEDYQRLHGSESWELDAMSPEVLQALITDRIAELIDWKKWERVIAQEEKDRAKLQKIARDFK